MSGMFSDDIDHNPTVRDRLIGRAHRPYAAERPNAPAIFWNSLRMSSSIT
jgi:hypothetical protein